jgi:hypothetical protein
MMRFHTAVASTLAGVTSIARRVLATAINHEAAGALANRPHAQDADEP